MSPQERDTARTEAQEGLLKWRRCVGLKLEVLKAAALDGPNPDATILLLQSVEHDIDHMRRALTFLLTPAPVELSAEERAAAL